MSALTSIHTLTIFLAMVGISVNIYFFFAAANRWRLFAMGNALGCLVVVWIFVRNMLGLSTMFHQYEQMIVVCSLLINTIVLYYQTRQDKIYGQDREDRAIT